MRLVYVNWIDDRTAVEKPTKPESARSIASLQRRKEYMEYAVDFIAKNINNFVDVTEGSVKSFAEVAAAQADIVPTELGLRPEVTSWTRETCLL